MSKPRISYIDPATASGFETAAALTQSMPTANDRAESGDKSKTTPAQQAA